MGNDEKFRVETAETTLTQGNPTVTDEQMAENIKTAEDFIPLSSVSIDEIKEHWKAAHSYAFEKDETEEDLSDDIKNDAAKFEEWKKQTAKTAEYRKMLRDKFESMTDDDFRAWANEINSSFKSTVGLLKRDLSQNNLLLMSPEQRAAFETQQNLDNSILDMNKFDEYLSWKKQVAHKERLRFLRITNPKRKRGNPIDREPEQFHEFLKECRCIRSHMDFDHMDKTELKTRLIQEVAGTNLYVNQSRKQLAAEHATSSTLINIVDKILAKYPDIVSDSNITSMLNKTGLFEIHSKE